MSRRPISGNGRAQTQRIASGARANPYSRPEVASKQTSQQYPPNQLSIRGSSGPTWILIQNLLRGTSEADIQSTFQQFGKIEAVRSHRSSGSDQSLSFEVAFTHSTSAQGAIDKLNGALADGRVLSVRLRDNVPNKPANASGSKVGAVQPPRAPARDIAAAAGKANYGKELFPEKAVSGAKNGSNSLSSRLMSATELKALSKKQAQQKKKAAAPEGALSAPGFNQISPSSAVALSKRIGSLPLAARLAEANAGSTTNGKKKDSTGASLTVSQKKRKRAIAKAKAANSSGMQLD